VAEPTVLRTVLADYPHTMALKRGELTDPALRLDFHHVAPVHKAFAPMVRDEAYDVSELAIVTALQAIAYERPVVLLPAVVASRFQRGCLIASAASPVPTPEALAGKRIGVRAYTQTTGMWVRTHLAEDYGLAPERLRWITRDGAHVAQYQDPDYVEHGIGERSLTDLLRDGEIDATILGNDLPDGDEFVPVIPDAAARDRDWWQRNGFMPINHMVVASRSLCRRDPDAVRAAYTLLRRADEAVPRLDGAPHPTLFGFDRLQHPVEVIIDTCLEQGLLPRKLSVDEVFGPARDVLGDLGE
jgi:4,5-dihydroxyphthalate decarboxylase